MQVAEDIRTKRLSTALRIIGALFIVAFSGFFVLVLLNSPLAVEGGLLAQLLRWKPHNLAYESMLTAIYVVWGIMLWRAAENPQEHRSLIDFTIWGNLAHAVVMLVGAFAFEGESLHAVSDVVLLGAIVGVLYWLRPSEVAPPVSPAG